MPRECRPIARMYGRGNGASDWTEYDVVGPLLLFEQQ
jgi:hypothetical protein